MAAKYQFQPDRVVGLSRPSSTVAPLRPPSARSISTDPKFQTLSGSTLTQEAPRSTVDGRYAGEENAGKGGRDENEKGDECEIRESHLKI